MTPGKHFMFPCAHLYALRVPCAAQACVSLQRERARERERESESGGGGAQVYCRQPVVFSIKTAASLRQSCCTINSFSRSSASLRESGGMPICSGRLCHVHVFLGFCEMSRRVDVVGGIDSAHLLNLSQPNKSRYERFATAPAGYNTLEQPFPK